MQGVFFVPDDDGVTRIVSAVKFHNVVDATRDEVGRFALTLVAPLGTNNHDGGHANPLFGQPPQSTVWP